MHHITFCTLLLLATIALIHAADVAPLTFPNLRAHLAIGKDGSPERTPGTNVLYVC